MKFNEHYNLRDRHAFLSPSQPVWLHYDLEKLAKKRRSEQAIIEGTELHELAEGLIRKRRKQLDDGDYFNMYVNDAIGFRMKPEVTLYYSDLCFGKADTIKYDSRNKLLRIHDLKTGATKPHHEQLETYAALFCLEYDVKPSDIDFELRIYQRNKPIDIWTPGTDIIFPIMDTIVSDVKYLRELIEEEENW